LIHQVWKKKRLLLIPARRTIKIALGCSAGLTTLEIGLEIIQVPTMAAAAVVQWVVVLAQWELVGMAHRTSILMADNPMGLTKLILVLDQNYIKGSMARCIIAKLVVVNAWQPVGIFQVRLNPLNG
jgi:hypothetical protein